MMPIVTDQEEAIVRGGLLSLRMKVGARTRNALDANRLTVTGGPKTKEGSRNGEISPHQRKLRPRPRRRGQSGRQMLGDCNVQRATDGKKQ